MEYGLIERNPARGKRRRLKAKKPPAAWLDSAEQIEALSEAAGQLDTEAKSNHRVPRRAMLATLVFAGPRIGELIALRWRDADPAGGRLYVRSAKTDAGVRTVDLLPVPRKDLGPHKAQVRPDADGLVFATQAGTAMNPRNIRNRVLARSVARADELLKARGAPPLPEHLTPHKLRHTFASLLVALGVDPGAVMDQLGHTDPAFTLRVYRHGMRRDGRSRAQLRRLTGSSQSPSADQRRFGARVGELTRFPAPRALPYRTRKQLMSRQFRDAPGVIRTRDLSLRRPAGLAPK